MDEARLMTVFAHPDDETFGLAGTLARATRAGHPVAVVCATRGEAGEIANPALATKENLGQVREQELRAACAAVGVSDVTFLGYRDGQLAEADPDEVVGRIVAQVRRFRPQIVATFAPNGVYGHPDHMAIHRLTLAAVEAAADPARYPNVPTPGAEPWRARKVYYTSPSREALLKQRDEARQRGEDFIPGGNAATIPVEEMGTPEAEITTTIRLSDDEFEAKQRAMRSHATQLPPDNPFTSAAPEALRAWMGTETLTLAPPPISDRSYPTPEDDIFAGL